MRRLVWESLITGSAILLLGSVQGCSDDGGAGPPVVESTPLELSFVNLPVLDAGEFAAYEAWTVDSEGVIRSAGRFPGTASGTGTASLSSPIKNPTDIFVTAESAGDNDDQPSTLKIMGGRVSGRTVTFDVNRYVTSGVPLEEEPGTHVLFTPSDNQALFEGSNEDAGVWLFNIEPDSGGANFENRHFFLNFTPLGNGWTYEGWMVYEYGSENEVWLSYGKFQPDEFKEARFRDNSGFGPFSGLLWPDARYIDPEGITFPGDDWVGNPNGLPVPGDLPLPLDLNGCNPDVHDNCAAEYVGPSRFTHVVTVEPYTDREAEGDTPWTAKPFIIRPYRNWVGLGAANVPRVIEYFPEELPGGTGTLGT